MMKILMILTAGVFSVFNIAAQDVNTYIQEIKNYQKKYVAEHDVVLKKKDKKLFSFFPVNGDYKVSGHFEKVNDITGLVMKTSANTLKDYFVYGKVHFNLNGAHCHLFVYQSKDLMKTEKYKDYLFIPFTDETSGRETYAAGRYIDFTISDIQNNTLEIDFNKAYNPSCAYASGYKCPIPPAENDLFFAVKAGEMNYGKSH